MKPGDLVRFRSGMGFSWWKDFVFIYLHPVDNGWIKVLRNDGLVTEGNGDHFEVIQ